MVQRRRTRQSSGIVQPQHYRRGALGGADDRRRVGRPPERDRGRLAWNARPRIRQLPRRRPIR